MAKKEFANGFRGGSALILAVVLTSLLAVIGMIFIMTARIDRMSTSAISDNKDLNAAVGAVVAKISHKLAMDVPGMPEGTEYYDYPDEKNEWLASLEPYKDGTEYKWRRISDISGYINDSEQEDVNAGIVADHEIIKLDSDGEVESDAIADADGDGVADSKWIKLADMTSSKGERIYAAVRVIDNGGMLNVNTGYKFEFDPNNAGPDGAFIDGTDPMQINLFGLAQRSSGNTLDNLDDYRFGSEPQDLENYLREVVWRYDIPDGNYTPFDISDELELRNRYTLNRGDVDSRIEEFWDSTFQALHYLYTPVDDSDALASWEDEVYYDYDSAEPNDSNDYSYRHIGTIYNMDRIIDPNGDKMLNITDVNTPVDMIYRRIKAGLLRGEPNFMDVDETAAQIAVNLVDFQDGDSEVTDFNDAGSGVNCYGFETPCIYISELAHKFLIVDVNLPSAPISFTIRKSYAIELHKPYGEDEYPEPNDWRLNIDPYGIVNIDWSGSKRFHVVLFEANDVNLGDEIDFNDLDPNLAGVPQRFVLPPSTTVFEPLKTILLERQVGSMGEWIAVDSVTVPEPVGGWWSQPASGETSHSIQRDITRHKCIRRLWDSGESIPVTLGEYNIYTEPNDTIYIQAHPENRPFRNVGEIGKLFRADVYGRTWGPMDSELDVRLDLADPNYHGLFQYLTVMDPSRDGINNDGDESATDPDLTDEDALNLTREWKVPGRININTAPWFVISQLPWMRPEIAQAIVAYRDRLNMASGPDYSNRGEEAGFASIGELATVINKSGYDGYSMHYYALPGGQPGDLDDYPDLTANDGAPDDFEEHDVIFSRTSDLVTVRSDVFTAYILVRVGVDGPQKRAAAILDRSNVYRQGGRVRVIAVQPASDPR